jgi:formate--tetrahydrofolate ligase
MAGLRPSAVVIVATVRALKYHGGVPKAELNNENLEALEAGLPNLLQHVDNIKNVFGLPCVVAINAFPKDTEAELKLVEKSAMSWASMSRSVKSGPKADRVAGHLPKR